MNYYFDTSALIKNYIDESGSEFVSNLLDQSDIVFVSEITLIEGFSTLKRILLEKLITEEDYVYAKAEIKEDFQYFTIIDIETAILECERLIDEYQLKTLDSIQLSSALNIENRLDGFVCCDKKLISAAEKEELKIINPLIV